MIAVMSRSVEIIPASLNVLFLQNPHPHQAETIQSS